MNYLLILNVMAKLHITTWGCQMNEYDSSKMADLLNSTHGFELTENPEDADVLLLNTCSIREKAQEKVFSQLGRWKNWKKDKPNLIIGVGGCVASQEGEHIRDRAPYVDIVFGPQTLHRLPEMINQIRGGKSSIVDISFPEIEKFDRLPEPKAEGPTAFVSIMEGCNKYCSFCVVPYTRGEEVSRPVDDVLFEIAQLAAQGVREVNLLGPVKARLSIFLSRKLKNLTACRSQKPKALQHSFQLWKAAINIVRSALCLTLVAKRFPARWMTYYLKSPNLRHKVCVRLIYSVKT
ncbi:hypothetical protein C4O85_11725 [Mannheimia haemolytica]|nr:hypothetical protein C4O85_11725 [Mannheimia haemolytica]